MLVPWEEGEEVDEEVEGGGGGGDGGRGRCCAAYAYDFPEHLHGLTILYLLGGNDS